MMQARFDRGINERYGKVLAFLVRLSIPMILLFVIAVCVPFFPNELYVILPVIVITGMCSSVSYGTLFQLVTLYPKAATSMLSLGYSSPGVLVPMLGLLMFGGFDDRVDSPMRFLIFWESVAFVVLVGFISYLILMWNSKPLLDAQQALDSGATTPAGVSIQTPAYSETTTIFPTSEPIEDEVERLGEGSEPVFINNPGDFGSVHLAPDQPLLADVPVSIQENYGDMKILQIIWKAVVAIFLSNVSRLLVLNVLSHVPDETDVVSPDFSQKLIFINLGSDLAGRFCTLPFMPQLPKRQAPIIILMVAVIQLISASYILILVLQPLTTPFMPRNDIAVQVFLGCYAAVTGYLQTSCYIIAPSFVPLKYKTQVGALMNIFIQGGNLVALGIGYALEFGVFEEGHRANNTLP